ncbi:hypothetical protein AAGS40_29685 (plasmid) [Paraburkholderia sp. PREW-6R]|uniref:hypothetical protein n=1 Tax=Paraburkholderia sp. PREW-6R TaxID=3141544 RepID=UPI0031F5CD02
MNRRLYLYQGFEIGVVPLIIPSTPNSKKYYRCVVSIRNLADDSWLEIFPHGFPATFRFQTEFDAVLDGCIAAERRIHLHHAYRQGSAFQHASATTT